MEAPAESGTPSSCPFAEAGPEGCVCIALSNPKRVSVDYQSRFCFTNQHVRCRRYQRAVPEIPDPESPSRFAWRRDTGAFVAAGVVVIVIAVVAVLATFQGTWAGWFSGGDEPSSGLVADGSATANPTVVVIAESQPSSVAVDSTPEPSTIPVITASPTAIPVTPTVEPTAIPSPTPSATASPAPSPTPSPTTTPTPPSPTPVAPVVAQAPVVHTVAAGETLSAIASRYGVSAALIAGANQISNVDLITPGTKLFIPSSDGRLPPEAPLAGVHIVVPGDSLSVIASNFGVSVQTLMTFNGISNADTINAGSVIKVPKGNVASAPVAPVARSITYTVEAGDTLYSLGKRFGVSIEALMAANNLTDRSAIYTGQVLTIPQS